MKIFFLLLFPIYLYAAVPTADFLIKNGLLYDGTGGKPQKMDLFIQNDRILDMIESSTHSTAKTVIDAKGLIVAPGFIHLNRQNATENSNINYLREGFSTSVTGNCGSGAVYVGQYLEGIEKSKTAVNIAHLIPFDDLRKKVMRDNKSDSNSKEMDVIKSITAQGMQEGAWGLSAEPYDKRNNTAKTNELATLAKIVTSFGGIQPLSTTLSNACLKASETKPTQLVGLNVDKEKQTTLEQVIRSKTSLPANILGLSKRGELKRGFFADIVLFDPRINKNAVLTKEINSGFGNVQYLFINGKLTIEKGQYTSTLAGRVLYHLPNGSL